MQLIATETRDIYFLFEISLTDIKKLKTALDSCELKLDQKDPDAVAAHAYFMEKFYPLIKETRESVENGST